MLISNKKNIEDIVIETLSVSLNKSGLDLVSDIQKIRPKTTKQAVYSALRFLLQEDIILKIENKYLLNRVWSKKLINLLNTNESKIIKDPIFNIKNGEFVSYNFSTFAMCDNYWAHIFDLLIDYTPRETSIFIWNPHEWLTLGRSTTENYVFRLFEEKRKKAYFSIQGKTELDLAFKKKYKNDYIHINTGDGLPFKDNYYVNVFSDFVIEVTIDPKLAKEINTIYQNNNKVTKKDILFLENLTHEKYKVKMKISRNNTKAEVLRKKLSRDFYIN